MPRRLAWADAYIKRRGMPQVDVERVYCDHPDRIQSLVLRQHDVLGEGGIWPVSTQVLLGYANGRVERLQVRLESEKADFGREAHALTCPDYIFANDQDYAYGLFLLNERSRKAVMTDLGRIPDVFERTLLWGSLWDSVREADLDPRSYLDLWLRDIPGEADDSLTESVLNHAISAMHHYVSPTFRAEFVGRAEALAFDQMLHAASKDKRIIWFRGFRNVAETETARGHLKDMLTGKLVVPGVELRQLDRWNMVAALIRLNDPEAGAFLAAEQKRDPSGEGQKYSYVAQAANPESKSKQQYFDDYLHKASLPEDWVEQSLGEFNSWNQAELTAPWLKPALDALPQVKRERKIFFMLAWLNAFIGGQQSAQAQRQVHEFLNTAALDKDLKLKILQVVDELDRTVKIRNKYQ
jgi:aminopeptidase N